MCRAFLDCGVLPTLLYEVVHFMLKVEAVGKVRNCSVRENTIGGEAFVKISSGFTFTSNTFTDS